MGLIRQLTRLQIDRICRRRNASFRPVKGFVFDLIETTITENEMTRPKRVVRTLTDPHDLLDWVVDQALQAGEQLPMTDAFMDMFEEFLDQVRSRGFLPAASFNLFVVMNRLSEPEENPSEPRHVNGDLVDIMTELIYGIAVSELDTELYSLVERFAEMAELEDELSVTVGKREVRITSERTLKRTHGVVVDVTVARKLRYDANAPRT
jgi:hypothetical protein